jgi:hypothetical protein
MPLQTSARTRPDAPPTQGGLFNPAPVILSATVCRAVVALMQTGRHEAEIVLFVPPKVQTV